MAKKTPNKDINTTEKVTENHYELKTDAVDRLVNADKKTYSDSSKRVDPGKQYRSGFLDRIPKWVLAVFMKFWFAGAVCYFIYWGLGIYITDTFDMIFVLSVVLGMVTDLLVNNAFRFFETYKGQNSKWMMFPYKKFWTFPMNIVYAFVLMSCVVWFYNTYNLVMNNINGTVDKMYLGVEPLLFGILYLLIDLAFIGIKNALLRIIKNAKSKNGVKN